MNNIVGELTAGAIPTLKEGTYWDDVATGLHLLVGKGRKTWQVRSMKDGKYQFQRLGFYPQMGLAVARETAVSLFKGEAAKAPKPSRQLPDVEAPPKAEPKPDELPPLDDDDDEFFFWRYTDLVERRIVNNRTDLSNKQKLHGFPRPVKLAAVGRHGTSLFQRKAVQDWIRERMRIAQEPKK